MTDRDGALLALAEETVIAALRAGADEAEAYLSRTQSTSVALQKSDVKGASADEETTIGVRVFVKRALGFATANHPEDVASLVDEAIAIARVSPPDPQNGLPEATPIPAWSRPPDPAVASLTAASLAALAAEVLDHVRSKDSRVSVDSGGVSADVVTRAIASSRGVRGLESHATASGSLFGMAVDGDVVGSFDADGDVVRSAADLRTALLAAADRFVIKTTAALHAGGGDSFKGTVILSPDVVAEFLVSNLLAVLSAKAVRTGKSPLKGRLGKQIAAKAFTLVDDAGDPSRSGAVGFDREGVPSARRVLVNGGVLESYLYDAYEARVAGGVRAGNARGGAGSTPTIGPQSITVPAGPTTFGALCSEPKRAVLVSRFSGSSNPITGEFSGVVKGGFLLGRGERAAIREVQISGNLYDALGAISGVSIETRLLDGNAFVPAIRIEDVSVTAG